MHSSSSFIVLALFCILAASASAMPVHRRQAAGGSEDSSLNSTNATTAQAPGKWWCSVVSNVSADRVEEVKRLARTIGYTTFGYIHYEALSLKLLQVDSASAAAMLPQPLGRMDSPPGLQAVADWSLNLTHYVVLYRMALRNLELHGTLTQLSDSTSQLDTLTIILDHYLREVEKYLQLSKCSCKGVECTLTRTINQDFLNSVFAQMIQSYTPQQVLRSILEKIQTFNDTLQPYLGTIFNRRWSLCRTAEIISHSPYITCS